MEAPIFLNHHFLTGTNNSSLKSDAYRAVTGYGTEYHSRGKQ